MSFLLLVRSGSQLIEMETVLLDPNLEAKSRHARPTSPVAPKIAAVRGISTISIPGQALYRPP